MNTTTAHVAATMTRNADSLDRAATHTTCTVAAAVMRADAIAFRQAARILNGDIGEPEEQEEWEISPLTIPEPQPIKVPA